MSMTVIEAPQLGRRELAPFLTIGIPTWNRAQRLEDQLDALAPFLSDDVALLVCDNGSDDGTWEILQSRVKLDLLPIRCVRNGANLGADANFLRVIEAASGCWLWLVGDDDPINFAILPQLIAQLRTTRASLMLLLDVTDGFHPRAKVSEYLDSDAFFAYSYDRLALFLQQVGRVLCRVAPAHALLRTAYSQGMGELHAYTMIYGALLSAHGLQVATLRLLASTAGDVPPRWNLLRGHVGAWKTALKAFPGQWRAVQSREVRLRQKTLLIIAIELLANRRDLSAEQIRWMLQAFDLKGCLLLVSILCSFKLSRELSMWLLMRFSPGLALRTRLAGEQLQDGY